MRTVFTTGQVAKICNVAPRTVAKWIDSGCLQGYRIPESQDRRVLREILIRFLKERGVPLGELEDEAMGKILLVGTNGNVRSKLNKIMGVENFKVESAASGFDAGVKSESLNPDCVVVDFTMGRNEALMIAENLQKNTVLIGLLRDEDNDIEFDRTLFTEVFRKPFDVALLAARIQTLIGKVAV